MLPYFTEVFGNADSLHSFGRESHQAVTRARNKIAQLIGAKPSEIYFTSGGTESDNWALKGLAQAKGKHIITSAIEHPAIRETLKELKKQGVKVTVLPVTTDGVVIPESLENVIDESVSLVSIMFANNEVGTIQPIKQLAAIARKRKVAFHTDAVQAVGNLKVDVAELGVDMMSFSAHKFYGPKGIGVLYCRSGLRLEKLIIGGHQERTMRGGTTNVPLAVGMAEAMELAINELEKNTKYIAGLRDYFIKQVEENIPFVRLNGNRLNRVAGNANFSFEFIEGESILMSLDLAGIACSTGSACSSGSLDPSHVLLAMGVPIEIAHGSIRFSFGRENTKEDADYVVQTLIGIEKQKMYNDRVIEEFKNPNNVGEMPDADGVGTVGNASCGDIMKIYLKVEDNIIKDVKFQTFGCAAAIATSSLATTLIKGKTIDEALKVTNKQVVEGLGGLPAQKIHCSVLAEEAIKAAIDDYQSKKK
ncbi:cysteine desulfurylase family member [Holotrichia oblita]|nr:cysteine desulfurylase family member [Holotrichia oblita]